MVRLAHGLLILLVALAALINPAQPAPNRQAAPANSIVVNNLLDPPTAGKCGLRDAITAANTNLPVNGCTAGAPGLDTITFSLGGGCHFVQCGVVLAAPLPAVTEDVTINGGTFIVQISGEHLYRVFDLGAVAVNLLNLRIINGWDSVVGGGIRMAGTLLTVNNVYFAGNQSKFNGGAIDETSGTLYLYNSTFSGNSSLLGGGLAQIGGAATISQSTFLANTGDNGGAIGLVNIAALHVSASVFDGNSANVWGSAIYLQDTSVQATITSSTFRHNQALTTTASFGGTIWLTQGTLTLSDSALVSNTSASEAGALGVYGGQASLTNVTVSGNSAKRSGGGLFALNESVSRPVTVTLNNVTVTGNTADSDNNSSGDGGGIAAPSGTLNVQNSILAGNFDTPGNTGAGTIHPDCSVTVTSATYSFVGIQDGCVGAANGSNGNQVGTLLVPLDPGLAPLADNGGPTLTQALLPNSPAINAGNPLAPGSGGLACAAADQRGVVRPLGIHCDQGAFEAGMRVFLALVRR